METLSVLKIHYLDKIEITLRTDCQAIIAFYNKSAAQKPSRVRWLSFTDYIIGLVITIQFEHIEGRNNILADNLSRLMFVLCTGTLSKESLQSLTAEWNQIEATQNHADQEKSLLKLARKILEGQQEEALLITHNITRTSQKNILPGITSKSNMQLSQLRKNLKKENIMRNKEWSNKNIQDHGRKTSTRISYKGHYNHQSKSRSWNNSEEPHEGKKQNKPIPFSMKSIVYYESTPIKQNTVVDLSGRIITTKTYSNHYDNMKKTYLA
ncbi:hypothetical protein MA16_Dca008979 [Dendrobium catenatum]|uniref:Reverse transcriptase RNase H-like domain-containing protein n=1 Tax=Dendrobium catenatum TaxID=906689 RepID=A0A2I0WRR6_9ASPA|nr:hypothetical protein MA16_Dca008979 [Dendrobium catenatum]